MPRSRLLLVCLGALVIIVGGLTLAQNERQVHLPSVSHGVNSRETAESSSELASVPDSLQGASWQECQGCHGHIEVATENMRIGAGVACTFCHGGDPNATTKEEAHVQPALPPIMDKTVAPLDYDLPYMRFVNPTNLRVAHERCGECHPDQVARVMKSMMTTAAGHYAGGMYQNGVIATKTPVYGTFAAEDIDGYVPWELGAVQSLEDLIVYDPLNDPALVSTHFQAVPSQACARCHLWSRGKGYRGAEGADGVYRADGCAACHMVYHDDGLSRSADASIDHEQPGHPMEHVLTTAIPTEQCLHCHHRGARIGLSYTGRAQMPPELPSGPGVPGTTEVAFNGNYHYADAETNPPDIHREGGMECIDCHTGSEIMGDHNIYGHMDQATKIECQTCHGTPTAEATLRDNDGVLLNNATRDLDGEVVIRSKMARSSVAQTDATYIAVEAVNLVDPDSPRYNAAAACAMNEDHLRDEGGLECYACHSSWVPNCFGCHFQRDEQQLGLNLITREWEVGKASTNNKIFESLKHFTMGPNKWGRIAPYIVGCHPIADVTAPDGSKILDFAMPYTVNGLSGLAHQPVNPHTVRGKGEVRSCAECHRAPSTLGLGSGNYAVARKHAYAATNSGVTIVDRGTDPTEPILVGNLSSNARAIATLPNVVEGTADYLFVAAGEDGLLIFDMRAGVPESPVATLDTIDAIDVSRVARYLYVVVDGVGVNIYDNRDPETAVLVAVVPIPTAVRAIPWGIHLFVPAGPAGLVIVDIADHHAPSIATTVDGMQAVDVQLYAHYQMGDAFAARAYVADPSFGVRIVDLLPDVEAATVVAGLPVAGASGLDTYTRYVLADATTPSREHDYLYVAAGINGLRIYDITRPDDIVPLSTVALSGIAADVDVASQMTPPGVDDYALVANPLQGLQVVDVTDPTNPLLLTSVVANGASRLFVEVQQLDRFIDEQGNELKENSHPGVSVMSRGEIVRILAAEIPPDCP